MEKQIAYRITVYGGEMNVSDFALNILKLVNYKSSCYETILDVKTVQGTNTVIVDSYDDVSNDLKTMFNTDDVLIETLNIYMVDWCDLGKEVASEINELIYEKEEEVLIIGE